jgi:hypothetical protein
VLVSEIGIGVTPLLMRKRNRSVAKDDLSQADQNKENMKREMGNFAHFFLQKQKDNR